MSNIECYQTVTILSGATLNYSIFAIFKKVAPLKGLYVKIVSQFEKWRHFCLFPYTQHTIKSGTIETCATKL